MNKANELKTFLVRKVNWLTFAEIRNGDGKVEEMTIGSLQRTLCLEGELSLFEMGHSEMGRSLLRSNLYTKPIFETNSPLLTK